ncbi:MAG: cytochrome C oxidase subunit IV family protein [Geminicoccaceae bacterium]|nr:cytochrome C oxidase subunit IV family protein [Geminicoccaceae bacterium]
MSERTLFVFVYLVLLGLLATTIGVSYLELGPWNPVLNLSIAAAKAFLIVWFFMHLNQSAGLVRLAAFAGLVWLALLFTLGLADWLTRPDGWMS